MQASQDRIGRSGFDASHMERGNAPSDTTAIHPFAFLAAGWRHRRLIRRLAWRRIESVYRGSVLGLAWAILHPLLLLAVYTFVFSVVFQMKWGGQRGDNAEFALFVFSGMILYAAFAQTVNDAPHLIHGHQIYIKQLVFPTEILSMVSVATSLFTLALSGLVLVAFYVWVHGMPPWTVVYVPLLLVPLVLLSLGTSWILSSLAVFLEDISHLVGIVTTALLFLSPIFYTVDVVPPAWRGLYMLNPFAVILPMSKDALFHGRALDPGILACLVVATWTIAWVGWIWFLKTRKSFADVL